MTRESGNQKKNFYYKVYGLTVRSELELPELEPTICGQYDVFIRCGKVSNRLPSAIADFDWIAFDKQICLIRIENVARYLISNGNEIVVERRHDRTRKRGCGIPISDVRLFLLGSAFGALLHQRNCLPLHVSAVRSPHGLIAFTGDSGAGKSTIAGWFYRRLGWPIITDDVAVLNPREKRPLLYPGPRKMKLWEDAVRHLDCADYNLFQDLTNTPKFQVYLDHGEDSSPYPLHSLLQLERCSKDERPSLIKLNGAEAFTVFMRAVYRPYMAVWFRNNQDLMKDLHAACMKVKVYRYRRQWVLSKMEDQHALIIKHMSHKQDIP